MAYECLPLHLMKTVKELDELRLNSYYFVLHISIDNPDTGHAAMAMLAATDYVEHIAAEEGECAAQQAWKRIQAGFVLADGLPTTPETPSQKQRSTKPSPWTNEEAAAVEIFKAKSRVAQKIHCNSRLKIGRHTLVEWLDPTNFEELAWQRDFMDDLSNRKPWVVKGRSDESRLIRELSWEGRMFGSFIQREVETIKRWIDSLGPSENSIDADVYYDFVGVRSTLSVEHLEERRKGQIHYPAFNSHSHMQLHLVKTQHDNLSLENSFLSSIDFDITSTQIGDLLALWFASGSLLECFVNLPVRVSSTRGSAIVKILRAQYGYDLENDGVAGTDELNRTKDGKAIGIVEVGLDMYRTRFLTNPKVLDDVLATSSETTADFAKELIDLSMKPLQYGDTLIGMTWAFMELHGLFTNMGDRWLSAENLVALKSISCRERHNLLIYLKEMQDDDNRLAHFWGGCKKARDVISNIFLCSTGT